MYKHHEESIENMIEHYRENKEIAALFLIGSVATGTERPDSDLDAVAVVSEEYYKQKKAANECEDVYYGKCTYDGGYFNLHYYTREHLKSFAESGSEPMRNMFCSARTLYCNEEDLISLVTSIPVFQKEDSKIKQLRFYSSMKMFYTYFWRACKPTGFMKMHVAHGIIYNLYRLILIENEILFPSARKLEDYANLASKKPNDIINKCHKFMETLSDEDCLNVISSYEEWTNYDYPKDHKIVMNNFSNPYEWN